MLGDVGKPQPVEAVGAGDPSDQTPVHALDCRRIAKDPGARNLCSSLLSHDRPNELRLPIIFILIQQLVTKTAPIIGSTRLSPQHLAEVAMDLNNRPRKIINDDNPAERFAGLLTAE